MAWSRALAARPRHILDHVEFLPALCDRLRGELGEVVVVELPGGVLAPPLRRLHGGARAGRALQHAEGELERLRLRPLVEGSARRVAKGKVAEEEARHAAV